MINRYKSPSVMKRTRWRPPAVSRGVTKWNPLAVILQRLIGVGVSKRVGDVAATKQHILVVGDSSDGAEMFIGERLQLASHDGLLV